MSPRSTTEPEVEGLEPSSDETISRRGLLRTSALLGGAVLAAPTAWAIGPGRPDYKEKGTLFRQEYPANNPDNIVFSTCLGCHAACPVRVAREDGILAKMDGNPFSTRNWHGVRPKTREEAAHMRGVLCARGQARLQNTHDPYRLLAPLAREGWPDGGTRGDGRWTTLGPREAVETLQNAVGGPDGEMKRLVIAVDPRQQDRQPALAAFAEATQSDLVHLGHPTPWLVEASAAVLETPDWILVPRWERARGALIWGADAVSSGVDQIADSRAIEHMRDDAPIIVVDPRLSETAARAELWLPVRPGGDAALAWLLARAWYESGLFEPPDEWLRALLVRPVPYLEQQCGLGYDIVKEAGRLLAEAGDGLAVRIGGGVGDRAAAADVTEAILRLAILAGATGAGGAMEPVPLPTILGRRPVDALANLLEDDGKIDVLLVTGDGGIVDSNRHNELLAALADPTKVGQLIVCTTTMNPVAALADVILPDLTEHERSGLVTRWDGISSVEQVIPPVLAHTDLPAALQRGLEGHLEVIALGQGAALDTRGALAAAIEATGAAAELRDRGWLPPAPPVGPPPTATPFREDASHSPGRPVTGLALVTFREPFGGFVDSTAQYWSTPSLRRTNQAWVHPATADNIRSEHDSVDDAHHKSEESHGGGSAHGAASIQRTELTGGGAPCAVDVRPTPAARPGVVAIAIGYGHDEGFDGTMEVDGILVQRDARRCIGVDVGALTSARGDLHATPLPDEKKPSLLERLKPPPLTCARL